MLKKYKHISFDLDGTLVHTLPEYRNKIVPETVRQLGGKISSLRSIDKFWFEANRGKIIQEEFGLDPKDFWEVFRKLDIPSVRTKHTFAYEDANMALKKLKDMQKLVSIITGAPHTIANMEIKKLNKAPYDYYFSINDSKFHEKPDPESFLHVLSNIKVLPKESLYIGNSNEDAYFAKNAGADFIYLERQEHQFKLLEYSKRTINSLSELFN